MVSPKTNQDALKDALDRYNASIQGAAGMGNMLGSVLGAQNQQSLLGQYMAQRGAVTASIAHGTGVSNTLQRSPQERYLDPNDDPAYQPALSTAVDMWALRHGNRWVNISLPVEEGEHPFAIRLESANLLESLHRGGNKWVRLKEQHGNR